MTKRERKEQERKKRALYWLEKFNKLFAVVMKRGRVAKDFSEVDAFHKWLKNMNFSSTEADDIIEAFWESRKTA